MPVRTNPRAHAVRLAGHARVVLAAWLAACGYAAGLGQQCPQGEPSCADAGRTPMDSGRPTLEAGSKADPTPPVQEPDAQPPRTAPEATPPPVQPDADAGAPDADPQGTGSCRSVTMSFFACASGSEQPGTPQLRAGQSYTLRVRGDFTLDTTFQVRGASASCTGVTFDPLTLAAGGGTVERCLRPLEDVALLVTVMSGDPAVWVEGLMAEICDGCK